MNMTRQIVQAEVEASESEEVLRRVLRSKLQTRKAAGRRHSAVLILDQAEVECRACQGMMFAEKVVGGRVFGVCRECGKSQLLNKSRETVLAAWIILKEE